MNVRMEKTLLPDRNTLCLSEMSYEFRGSAKKPLMGPYKFTSKKPEKNPFP